MNNVNSGICEFCNEYKEYVIATQFHGFYCDDCIKLLLYYEREALKEIKEAKTTNKILKRSKNE